MIGLLESIRSGKPIRHRGYSYFESGGFSGVVVPMDRYDLVLHSEGIRHSYRWTDVDPNDLPDKEEWETILQNLDEIEETMVANGGDSLLNHYYWTGSDDGDYAWCVGTFYETKYPQLIKKTRRACIRTCERLAW